MDLAFQAVLFTQIILFSQLQLIKQLEYLTESFYAPLSLAELFLSLGGALGLRLGLGVIQIVENAITFGGILHNAMYKNIIQRYK